MNLYLLAAAAGEAPQSNFGFVEAMTEGGPVAWSILAVMVVMSPTCATPKSASTTRAP